MSFQQSPLSGACLTASATALLGHTLTYNLFYVAPFFLLTDMCAQIS